MRYKKLLQPLLLGFLTCLSLYIHAQPKSTPPPQKDAELLTTFKFQQFYGGVVVIMATLSDKPDTLQFILDTGSAGISLDTLTAVRLGLKLSPSDKIVRGLVAAKNLWFAENHTLHLPGLDVDTLDFHINDYELISQVYGIQVDGIIGYSFLNRYIVQVDYDTEEIRVYSKGKFKYPRGGYILKPTALSSIPVVTAPIRNNNNTADGRYYFDTGAGMCLLLSTAYMKDSSVMPHRKSKVIQTEAQGLGGKMSMYLTTIKEFKLGIYNFRNVPTYMFDDITNITSYPFLAGMVGNDLLRRFNLTLNYEKKEIYLMPNSHFRDPFDYSYTGLVIYLINGQIMVTDVIKGSPAEKAGIKPGDEILAVNNNFSSNLQVLRDQLKNVGSKATLLITRQGELMMKKMTVKSIL
ncbi:aspartyl protease [Chitinophaga skermanii]|uniref:Aspartyl protease n=1 Tax=Chitinophaga skermanii TaxID=331697 RepID=A0A327QCB1_9BACT|nr:aspartyl protease family protein [Chitinophaga skermanii]RAJ01504.1 aspartyl protease [Chitinophaga skermanii]